MVLYGVFDEVDVYLFDVVILFGGFVGVVDYVWWYIENLCGVFY